MIHALLPLALALAPFSGAGQVDPDAVARLGRFLDEAHRERAALHPERPAEMGGPDRRAGWPELTSEAEERELSLWKAQLGRLWTEFDVDVLDRDSRRSARVFELMALAEIEHAPWRLYDDPLDPLEGLHVLAPRLLIGEHPVADVQDARAYVRRLRGIAPLLQRIRERVQARTEMGLLPPRSVLDRAVADCRDVLGGDTGESLVLADLRAELAGLEHVEMEVRAEVLAAGRQAVVEQVRPAYEELIGALEVRAKRLAEEGVGCWRWPAGAAYYQHALQRATGLAIAPEEAHQLGLAEVERLHGEMRRVLNRVDYRAGLANFFDFARENRRFRFTDDAAGRERCLSEMRKHLNLQAESLGELVGRFPVALLTVRQAEPWSEGWSRAATYELGTVDGSERAALRVNLKAREGLPTYSAEATAYRLGLPGRHLRAQLAHESTDLPLFRRGPAEGLARPHAEGWELYALRLAKDQGAFAEPYSEFGRLAAELQAACELVVDTGIHHRRWARAEALEWLLESSPVSLDESQALVDRCAVRPGEAAAATYGLSRLAALREHARRELGTAFDPIAFHDALLAQGALPLPLLEELVLDWIAERGASLAAGPQVPRK